MPTSSATSRQKANNNKRNSSTSTTTGYWQPNQPAKTSSFLKRSSREQTVGKSTSAKYIKHSSSSSSLYSQHAKGASMNHQTGYRRQETFQVNQPKPQAGLFCAIPSGPEADQEDSKINNNITSDIDEPPSRQTLSLSGQSILLAVGGNNNQATNSCSLNSVSSLKNMPSSKAVSQLTISGGGSKSTFLVNNSHYSANKGNSQISLQPPGTTASSTAHLHSLSMNNNAGNQQPGLSIQRSVSLKHIKSLIILLMAVDLLITIFVHQFSTQDQLNLWLFVSFKMRFSLLNLILSSLWFAVLIGAILFEVYPVLLISCLVDIASFVLLLVFSIVHFSRRIDYNSVQLTSVLALLFSVVVLHVYLVVLAGLTVYLTLAVKRRQKVCQRH